MLCQQRYAFQEVRAQRESRLMAGGLKSYINAKKL